MRILRCSDLARCLSAFVDGELEPSHALAVQDHVDQCDTCSARVRFARASRKSVRNAVRSAEASDAFRARVAETVAQASDAEARTAGTVVSGLMSWRITVPIAAAAAVVLGWASFSKFQARSTEGSPALAHLQTTVNASSLPPIIPVDDLVDTLVEQHANPLPPETSSPDEIAKFDSFIGVRVRELPTHGLQGQGRLLGARMVPVHEQRAAMFQYVMSNGRRVSVYMYNPKRIRLDASPALRQRIVQSYPDPVYVGYVRGYSVVATDRRGVGYAMASDLDEIESSKLLMAIGGN